MESRLLVIGGGGFIGSNFVKACLDEGYVLRVVDLFDGHGWGGCNLGGLEYIRGDYKDVAFMRSILDGVESVVHLAHSNLVQEVKGNVELEFENNILPSIRLMETCSELNVGRFVFFSSGGTIYGDRSTDTPILEEDLKNPISLYGMSKFFIEQFGAQLVKQSGFPLIVVRPSNAYGPGQLPFRGQGVIATALASAIQGRTFNVFGDGTIVRDYIHVRDITEALIGVMRRGRLGESYNLGTSRGISLRDLINNYVRPLVERDGYSLASSFDGARKADVQCNVLCSQKLVSHTGFRPRVDLEEGILTAWQWIKENHMKQ